MGYALEFVTGMVNLILHGNPGSYIFSTQKPIKVKHFCGCSFRLLWITKFLSRV